MNEFRRAYRPADRRVIGGVATGVADHFGVPVLYVRLAFIVGAWLHGIGVIAYLLLWRFLPLRKPELSPGLESATRRGLRTGSHTGPVEIAQTVALGALGIGVMIFIQATGRGIAGGLFAPLLIGVVGLAVIWRQFDDAAWGRWMRQTKGLAFTARIGVGAVLVVLSGVYFLTQERGWGAFVDLGSALGIALLGLLLILGPWVSKLLGDLAEERRERVRSQERADVAAHLHDSVLQTLALIQKQADSPREVTRLARSQERQLRSWLYGASGYGDGGERAAGRATRFSEAIAEVAGEVEDTFAISVQHVTVGDVELHEPVVALVQAAREAMVNAAKHAQVDEVSVYAEVEPAKVSVFVRDRGKGFDPEAVPADRHGLADSIRGRMERNGGSCTVKTSPGEGTEVRLELPVKATEGATP